MAIQQGANGGTRPAVGQTFRMIVIYHHARDYPDHNFVARQWFMMGERLWPSPDLFAVGQTLREVRAAIPPWLVCVPRQEGEDPAIIETWI